jgi:hypothetical protein
MNRDTDVDLERKAEWNEPDLVLDLGLDTLLNAMSDDDPFLLDISRRALLNGLSDPNAITYRQDVLRDFLAQPTLLHDLFTIVDESEVAKPNLYVSRFIHSPENTLHRSKVELRKYVELLPPLRVIAEKHAKDVRSEGLTRFFDMLVTELDDEYLGEVEWFLELIDSQFDVHMSASFGPRLTSENLILHYPAVETRRWWEFLIFWKPKYLTRTLRWEDARGRRELDDLRARGLELIADVVAESAEFVHGFLKILHAELGFYVACLKLHDQLTAKGGSICFPVPGTNGQDLAFDELYDPCLRLTTSEPVVGNSLDSRDARLIVITGANHGGKSTFLRSLGVSQLMFQAGMFAPARALRMNPAKGLFTHFPREEDRTMTSGKLEEDLVRMSEIVNHLTPGALVLCNESFAATNESEGSYLSREIVLALMESGVRVVFVTHMYELAHGLYADALPGAVFLRAPRSDDGTRSFLLVAGEPQPKSYGKDVFDRIFGAAAKA